MLRDLDRSPPDARPASGCTADSHWKRRIALELKTPWFDGTTHVIYEPLDFVAKLAALVPRPHKNLVVYHGVFWDHGEACALAARGGSEGRPARSRRLMRPASP